MVYSLHIGIKFVFRYTKGGGVHIITRHDKDNWSLEITDTGIGIPAKEQKKLFKLHFRGSNAINAKITGSGIGLMLVWILVPRFLVVPFLSEPVDFGIVFGGR